MEFKTIIYLLGSIAFLWLIIFTVAGVVYVLLYIYHFFRYYNDYREWRKTKMKREAKKKANYEKR